MNDNNTQDESVSQFLSITGSVDVNQALSYLEMADNNLETAISLFLEHSSSGVTSTNNNMDHNNYINDNTTDQVRAPDQTRRMRLMDFEDNDQPSSSVGIPMGMFRDSQFSTFQDPFHSMGFEPSSFTGGIGGMNAFQTLDQNNHHDEMIHEETGINDSSISTGNNHNNIIPNIRNLMNQVADQEYNGQEYNSTTNTNMTRTAAAAAAASSTTNNTTNARSLANLFQPPLHLIHTAGGFQGAKQVAKDTRRWLLVNLQSDEEFACHALNRDVWRDELVENLIREGFVFWQTVRTMTVVFFF